MPEQPLRALLIEEDAAEREGLATALRAAGYTASACPSATLAQHALTHGSFDLIAISGAIARSQAPALCRALRSSAGSLPVVLVLGWQGDGNTLVEAGADDALRAGFDSEQLKLALAFAARRRAEREHHAQAARAHEGAEADLRALIEAAPLGIALCRDDRIVHVNRATTAALAYDEAIDLIGHSYLALLHSDDLAKERARMAETAVTRTASLEHEVRLLRVDGTWAEFESVVVPLCFGSEPTFAMVLRDLAPQRRIERRLLLAEHMASLGTLSAGIAHELNNPLSYMLANLRFAQEDLVSLSGSVSDPQLNAFRELIAQASEGAERVQTIVRDLKRFSRIDQEGDEPADLTRVLDTAINIAWTEIKHRAKVEKRYSSLPRVAGQEARLGQIFLNLLTNAAQAIPSGQSDGHTITISAEQAGERVLVEVKDTGAGIPEAMQHRIFEPFFTTKPVGVGTGLGLSICREIIDAIGGQISVESQPGLGTTFRVSVPLARPSGVRARMLPSLPAPANLRPLRILVVDDEPNVVRALERALRGHEVTTATGGEQARRALEADDGDFDLVFCDLMMSNVSGMDLYAFAKNRRPGSESAFVFMTGGVFTQEATQFLAALPNPVVHKPFDIKTLKQLIVQRKAA